MRPNSTSTVIRPDLGALLYEFLHSPKDFVMPLVLPIFPTPSQNGQYPVIPKEAFLKIPSHMARAARSAYYRDDIAFETKDYATEDRGLEIPLDDTEKRMYGNLFVAEQVIADSIASKMLRKHELAGSTLLTNTSTFDNAAAAYKWNLSADADPRADVQARINNIRDNTGTICDTVVMAETSFQDVVNCAAFIEQCKYTKAVQLLPREEQIALVAAYLGVKKLRIVTAVYDASKKPNSSTITDIWTNTKIMVCKTADNPLNLKEPCVGRTFLWEEDSPEMLVMEMYREEKIRSDVYRGRGYMMEKVVAADLGNIITGVR